MTTRERELLRMAVIYLIANLDDAAMAFAGDEGENDMFYVDGETMPVATDDELSDLLNTLLQG